MAGPTTITWGDGTPLQPGPEQGTVPHTYALPGTYTVKVCDRVRPDLCADVEVTVPAARFTLTATPDPADPARFHFTAAHVTPPDAAVAFTFGDGNHGRADAIGGTATIAHTYTRTV
ncbi:hypothetical protein DY218_27230 [Streptomyces triticagri]|uniref:PKD domain-containing protein n=1 Tax=Streptomyces triticagri TaxID=2293568 RepID=A0A372LZA9_9ACTN|nr:hypothetical protein [Streptomyces triticagri]RFU83603.1 hypothetical protein DY218_27230 [Streptomyces triticagri]